MKLRTAFSIPAQTSELQKPNPPKKEDVKKAKFKDRTFDWTRNNRPRNKRSS